MTSDPYTEQILDYLTGDLDAAATEALRRHLAGGCAECAAALQETAALLGRLPLALDPVAPSAAARTRLMQRVSGAKADDRPVVAGRIGGALLAAACVGLVIGGLGTYFLLHHDYQGRLQVVQNALTQAQQDARDMHDMLASQQLKLVSLAGAEQPHASGHVVWDKERGQWHVYVFDLAPPASGKTYELWMITPDQRKIAAGTFDVDAQGRGSIVANVPADIGPIALAAVTDEKTGGVDQPQGKVQLMGKAE